MHRQRSEPKLTLETQYKLKDYLQSVSELELQVERQRQRLVSCHRDFEPFACFQSIDRNQDGKITALEIYSFLRYEHYLNVIESAIQVQSLP